MQQAEADTAERPVLGLDVDGVLVFTEPVGTPATEHHVTAWERRERNISAPVTAPAIIELPARDLEIVRVSAWGHNAHTALHEALELPATPWRSLPVQFDKARALAANAGDRPWMPIDDGGREAAEAAGV
ncbi:hypothetical protein [Streptomyces spongiae]|uniref:HAD family hydrolase n=1 Tax=Streptomyces spongiae TaxID=565072 RepID=A0A5N8XBH0_9ACTN|nr:hypothetical protein [Streptomyces spongiae]MPY56544.1 hypothetical protein [Streptomyces spongiae]